MQQFQAMALVVSKAFGSEGSSGEKVAETKEEAIAQFKAVFGG